MAAGKRYPVRPRAGDWQVVGVSREGLVAVWVIRAGYHVVSRRARLRGTQRNPKVALGRCARRYSAGTLVVGENGPKNATHVWVDEVSD